MTRLFAVDIFADLYPAIETVTLVAGQYLFRIGDPDENIFVVESGRLDVTISDQVGVSTIKRVGPGDSVTSLLSFLDVLTGHARPFRTVQARAEIDTVVLKMPFGSFVPILWQEPDLLSHLVQIIMARVQRVFFVALHHHLGMHSQLISYVSCQQDMRQRQKDIRQERHKTRQRQT